MDILTIRGFVAPPGATDRSSVPLPALRELRSVVLHPAQNCGVCKTNTSFAHYGGQIAIAQLEIQIPPDAQDDDLLIKVPTAEQFLHRYELGIRPIIADAILFCPRADADLVGLLGSPS